MELRAESRHDVDGGRDAGASGEGRGQAGKRGETVRQSQALGPGAPWEGPGNLPLTAVCSGKEYQLRLGRDCELLLGFRLSWLGFGAWPFSGSGSRGPLGPSASVWGYRAGWWAIWDLGSGQVPFHSAHTPRFASVQQWSAVPLVAFQVIPEVVIPACLII